MRFDEKPEQMLESLRERYDKDPEEYPYNVTFVC